MGYANEKYKGTRFCFSYERNHFLTPECDQSLLSELDRRYPKGILFTKDGRPLFPGKKINLWLKYQGNADDYYVKDVYCKKQGLDSAKYTAHHAPKSTKIVVVERDVHSFVKHAGGASDCRYHCSLPCEMPGYKGSKSERDYSAVCKKWYRDWRFLMYRVYVNPPLWITIPFLFLYFGIVSVWLFLKEIFSVKKSNKLFFYVFAILLLIALIFLFYGYLMKERRIAEETVPMEEAVMKTESVVVVESSDTLTNNIRFEKSSFIIGNDNLSELAHVIRQIKGNGIQKICIFGYASGEGDAEFNRLLSIERANSVKQYLILHGLSETSIEAIGRGIQFPKASNESEEGRTINRRVEIMKK